MLFQQTTDQYQVTIYVADQCPGCTNLEDRKVIHGNTSFSHFQTEKVVNVLILRFSLRD